MTFAVKMKKTLLLLICLHLPCLAQNDPRVMSNSYAPVASIDEFKDIFVSAYNAGNRKYIEGMINPFGIPEKFRESSSPISFLLPPLFNNRVVIQRIEEQENGIKLRLDKLPDTFSHLPEGMVPVAILEFTLPVILKDGTNIPTTYRFPVVKHEGKLFISFFNDKETNLLAE
jgi:hypothetical protein